MGTGDTETEGAIAPHHATTPARTFTPKPHPNPMGYGLKKDNMSETLRNLGKNGKIMAGGCLLRSLGFVSILNSSSAPKQNDITCVCVGVNARWSLV
jgi:hypothetical protein